MNEGLPVTQDKSCVQCGMCCSIYYLTFTDDDLKNWKKMEKEKIYPNPLNDGYVQPKKDILWKDGFYVRHSYRPAGGIKNKACPYLMYQPHYKKFICRLHKNNGKPEVCRDFVCMRTDRKSI